MAHVFVAPHPDDVALSCGGLIASLRELGQNVTIVTVFSGTGSSAGLTSYQREALGFGTKTLWPLGQAFNRANLANDVPVADRPGTGLAVIEEGERGLAAAGDDGERGMATPTPGAGQGAGTAGGPGKGRSTVASLPPAGVSIAPWLADGAGLEATQAEADSAAKRFWQRSSWYRRAAIHDEPIGGQPVLDDLPTHGAVYTEALLEAAAAGDIMAARRLEDERFAYFSEASVVFLDLADAVFRGYEGDEQLLGTPRPDDPAPVEILRREIARLEPQKVYFPLGIGNHVDHQLMRRVGLELLSSDRGWIMPGPDWAGQVVFYEDFPYAWWNDFGRLEDLPEGAFGRLPQGVSVVPEFADINDVLERKIDGISLYASQLDRLFTGFDAMADSVRGYGAKVARLGGLDGAAERYWSSVRL